MVGLVHMDGRTWDMQLEPESLNYSIISMEKR